MPTTPSNKPIASGVRVLPLEGGRNFRDLGGYPTVDGKFTRWRQVFRSGVLAGLTETDFKFLEQFGIKTILDFRFSNERQSAPTAWKAGKVTIVTFPDVIGLKGNPIVDALTAPKATADDVREAMKVLYRTITQSHVEMYRAMFQHLASGQHPMIIFDSAGKNRTGVAVGLLLSALGVPRTHILQDFALSDEIVDYHSEILKPAAENAEKDQYAWLRGVPFEVVDPFFRSDPAYLEAAFAYAEETSGSVDGFIREVLGIDEVEINSIREKMTDLPINGNSG